MWLQPDHTMFMQDMHLIEKRQVELLPTCVNAFRGQTATVLVT